MFNEFVHLNQIKSLFPLCNVAVLPVLISVHMKPLKTLALEQSATVNGFNWELAVSLSTKLMACVHPTRNTEECPSVPFSLKGCPV